MRVVVEHRAPMTEKKSNLSIARKPISIQGSPSLRPIEYTTAHGGFLSASAPSSPSIRALQTNVNSLRPKELPQLPFMTKNSGAEQGSDCQPRQRTSVPRQPKPKLNIRIRETGPRSVGSYNSISSNNSNINCDSFRAPAVPIKSSARRLSWSPAQAIPEGHYSKGFTLTTFRKTTDKTSSVSFPFNFSFATSSSTPVSTSIKRPSTNHLERKETLTPFRRFVGRSKSMKLKTPGPFVTTETENALRTERFDSFYNNEKENSSPQSNKPLDMYNAKLKDRNSLGDPRNHTNGIQSQERLPFIGGWKVTSDSWKEATPAPNVAPPTPEVKPAITAVSKGPCKPLWQNTVTTAEEIRVLGLSSQEVQKQETIFELIYTESEYLDDLKSIHKIFVEELNVKMAESRKKKRFSPDKSDVKLYERLARLLSHIKDLWNGHQSLLRSLQNKQLQGKPVVVDIGSVFESFYMFSIYDSYFVQYTTTSRDFQQITSGNSELCSIIKELLKSPQCKNLTLEGIFIKPIQRLQKYPLFFKDLMNLTSKSDPDYFQLEHALSNHQRELTKIDDRIWIEEHNEMLMDLQQRIKGLPSNFSLVEPHRYLILDGPVHRITMRQPSKLPLKKHSKSESYSSNGSSEWRDGFRYPATSYYGNTDDPPTLIHRPSQLDFYHLHAKPAFPSTPTGSIISSTSSFHSTPTTPNSSFPSIITFKSKYSMDSPCESPQRIGFFYHGSSSPSSATTLHSLSSVASPVSIPNSTSHSSSSSSSTPTKQGTVKQLVSQYNFNLSSSLTSLTSTIGSSKNLSSSSLYLPGIIKNSTDVEAEYHVFVFTDIVLWTKRVMSRYHRKEGTPWNFKLVEPVSRLTSVSNTSDENIFMCTSVNTSSTSYLVRTEDDIAARMWRTTIPTLVPFHCSRNLRDQGKK